MNKKLEQPRVVAKKEKAPRDPADLDKEQLDNSSLPGKKKVSTDKCLHSNAPGKHDWPFPKVLRQF